MKRYLYSVSYRRDLLSRRVAHRSVIAASADEARDLVAGLDPQYLGTVHSPRRRAEVVEASK